MKTKCNSLLISTLVIIIAFGGSSFQSSGQNPQPITGTEKKVVVDSIAALMTDKYVFPDVGKQMADRVLANLKDGTYDPITGHQEFAEALTHDLRSVSKDKHIGVRYNPEMIARRKKAETNENDDELRAYEKRLREAGNFNFEKVEILAGNVGYLKFNSFMDASVAGPTAIAAMNFLAHTDALIIDLTQNGGGSPSLIQLITSYFVEEPTHLNSFYIREGDKTEQFWTLPYVPGPKMTTTDLYVLTSGSTFSGAEEFTYNLKNLKRATIVGETTGGGAHPVNGYILNDNFSISVPFGRAVNPISGTNWEGRGVEPDIKISKDEAFAVAYRMALESRLEKETLKELESEVAWTLEGLQAKEIPYVPLPKKMKEYVGVYGPRIITLESGTLFYQREDRPKMKMIPMREDVFRFLEIEYFRLAFIRENGNIVAVEGRYDNGTTDRNDKN